MYWLYYSTFCRKAQWENCKKAAAASHGSENGAWHCPVRFLLFDIANPEKELYGGLGLR
jgi:hypothetical protein